MTCRGSWSPELRPKSSHSGASGSKHLLLLLILGLSAILRPRGSLAEEPSAPQAAPAAGVMDRDYSEYDPLGVRLRSVVVFPTVAFAQGYDDNIYALPQKTASYFYTALVGVRAQTSWSRNLISLSASGQADRYPGKSRENTNEYKVDLAGRLDIGRSADLTADVVAERLTEPRTANTTTPGTHLPIQYDEQGVTITAENTFDRIRISATGAIERFRYSNIRDDTGKLVLEDQRDYDAFLITPRIDYTIGPGVSLFVEADAAKYDYRLGPPQAAANHDATGVAYLVGVRLEPTHLISGELAVGYQQRWYHDPAFKQFGGLNARAKLVWYVTKLVNLDLEALNETRPTGVLSAGGENVREWRVGADYELLRNLVISGGGGESRYSYAGLARLDHHTQADLEATYHFNRPLSFGLKYGYQKQHSTGGQGGNNFTSNLLMFTITVRK